jgi:YidC/Oxa1 family membrane protein insertase
MSENRNLLIAIALSAVVLIGWQFFVGMPQMEKQREIQRAQQVQKNETVTQAPAAATPAAAGAVQTPGGVSAPLTGATRDVVLSASPRFPVETPRLTGSIALNGARVDDIKLATYHETVDPKSPTITLLSPEGAPEAFYAEFGWVAPAGSQIAVPGAKTVWTAPAGAKLTPATPVTLSYNNGKGLVFSRTFAVDEQYLITVTDKVENKGSEPVTLHPYGLISRHGTPQTSGYYILHEGLIGVMTDKLEEIKYADIEKSKVQSWKAKGGWLGMTDKYWAATLIPQQDKGQDYDVRFSSSLFGALKTYQTDYLLEGVSVAPGASAESQNRLFAGAKEVKTIDAYETKYGFARFDLMIDWGWFFFITKYLFKLIDYIYVLTGNFGIAILIVTLIVKAIFFPLANKSYASMTKMKKVQPEMAALKEKYPDDKMKQQQELMELYKREKINPVAGCWPVLLQIPVFFALYKVLFITIEMRHAPFYGWIKDLSAPDPTTIFNLFGLLPYTVPDISYLHLGVWPIIMGFTMLMQMQMNPAPPDPVQALMFRWMPLVFTFMLASFPAGLVIYWSWNNSLSVLQQGLIMRKYGVKIELWDNITSLFGKKKEATG